MAIARAKGDHGRRHGALPPRRQAPSACARRRSGVAVDGWMGPGVRRHAATTSPNSPAATVQVFPLPRQAACFPESAACSCDGENRPPFCDRSRPNSPRSGQVTRAPHQYTVFACQPNPVILRMPRVPWRVEVTVDPPIRPTGARSQPARRSAPSARRSPFAFVPFEELAEDEQRSRGAYGRSAPSRAVPQRVAREEPPVDHGRSRGCTRAAGTYQRSQPARAAR